MIELAPKWIMYDEFWRTLKRRNLWLITLRYVVVIMLLSLILIGMLVEGLRVDELYIGALAAVILIYNTVFHRTHGRLPDGYGPFHGLHFALLQMVADFTVLLALIYMTGGVDSPFFYFFIFHVIIGSLILPRHVINLLIVGTLSVITAGSILELKGSIPHIAIEGFLEAPMYANETYVVVHLVILATILFISNYLANSISK